MPLLIKNVILLDGSGKSPQNADVLIKGKRILAIGDFSRRSAAKIIDGRGAYLAPGFIDVGVSIDRFGNLLTGNQSWFLKQGITTVVGGQCGVSLAPIFHDSFRLIRERAHPIPYNIDWQTMGEFLKSIKKRRFDVNFGTFAGHGTIRHAITPDDTRTLAPQELKVLAYSLAKSLSEGAFGVSLGLGYSALHPLGEAEIRVLFDALGKHSSLAAIHLPEESKGACAAALNLLEHAAKNSTPVLFNHLNSQTGAAEDYRELLLIIDRYRAKSPIYFSITAAPEKTVSAISLLPLWAREDPEHNAWRETEAVVRQLENKSFSQKILRELPRMRGSALTILHAPSLPHLSGKTLKEFSFKEHCSLAQGLLTIIRRSKGHALFKIKDKDNASDVASTAFFREQALLTTNGTGFDSDRNGVFFEFLMKMASRGMELPAAIHRVTGLAAALLKISGRGLIRPRFFADLVLFDASGIRLVIVNGMPVLSDENQTNIKAGEVIVKK